MDGILFKRNTSPSIFSVTQEADSGISGNSSPREMPPVRKKLSSF